MVHLTLHHASLTDGPESVLVNASNTEVSLGSGVSAAIRRACGVGFQEHLYAELARVHGASMQPGMVLMTHAGSHPRARYVAHVAVMDYRDGSSSSFPTIESVRVGCQNLWSAVSDLPGGPHSVAMVALGAGVGNLGVTEPTRIACQTLKAHLANRPLSIRAVAFYAIDLVELLAAARVLIAEFPEVRHRLSDEVLQGLVAEPA